MNAKEIVRYLFLVGQELGAMDVQEPIQLFLIGSGYMLTLVRGRRTMTGNIDAVWVQQVYSNSDTYWRLKLAIQAVAESEGLDPRWMNTDSSDFVHQVGPLPKMRLWKQFGLLSVYLPPRNFILVHKLIAGYGKDLPDIEVLCTQLHIKTRKKAQKLIDKYIDQYYQDTNRVAEKLNNIFRL